MKKKIDALIAKGIDHHTLKDLYPGYSSLAVFLVDVRMWSTLIRNRKEWLSKQEVAESLLEAIDDPESGMASIVGRKDVKDDIASRVYAFSKGYKTFVGSFNNMFMGQAGVGKTAIAKVIGFVFSKLGILARNLVKITTRVDFIGQYIRLDSA